MQHDLFTDFIGIDISKTKLDLCLHCPKGTIEGTTLKNSETVITKYLAKYFNEHGLTKGSTVICAEYTGHYIYPLVQVCKREGYALWLEAGQQVKASAGLVRGKEDAVDAKRIALYAKRFIDRYRPFEPTDRTLEEIGLLQREMDTYIADRTKYKGQLKDMKGFMPEDVYNKRKKRMERLKRELDRMIISLEVEIDRLFKKNETLDRQLKVLTSIKGIGPRTAIAAIFATRAFSRFKSARQFCCHIGIAPFPFKSGSSINGKARVSQRADKRLKTLFHLAAISSIRGKGEFRTYFDRKVSQGKNKMSVINAIRGKLVHRIFALIRDNRMYVEDLYLSKTDLLV